MAFEQTYAKKFASRAGRFPHMRAKIGSRPAHEVVRERICEASPRRRITKDEFYRRGGFSNSQLFRKADRAGRWLHYELLQP